MSEGYVFVAGAISGVVEGVCVQPLEMLKTRLQINQGASLSMLPAAREIIREGGIRQLYRGFLPEILGLVPRATASLSTLELSQRLCRAGNGGELTTSAAYFTGGLSGLTEGLAFFPGQVIKVRLMAKEHLGRYKNTLDCLRQVVANEGLMALTTGLAPTLVRNCIWTSIYYGTMHEIDMYKTPLESKVLDTARNLGIGTCVGILATCFNAPFDVVKSRFQSQLPSERKYTTVLGALRTIYMEEGPQALYKGFVPKAIRLGVGGTIGIMSFRQALELLGAADTVQH